MWSSKRQAKFYYVDSKLIHRSSSRGILGSGEQPGIVVGGQLVVVDAVHLWQVQLGHALVDTQELVFWSRTLVGVLYSLLVTRRRHLFCSTCNLLMLELILTSSSKLPGMFKVRPQTVILYTILLLKIPSMTILRRAGDINFFRLFSIPILLESSFKSTLFSSFPYKWSLKVAVLFTKIHRSFSSLKFPIFCCPLNEMFCLPI
jgi:hypothetical protein